MTGRDALCRDLGLTRDAVDAALEPQPGSGGPIFIGILVGVAAWVAALALFAAVWFFAFLVADGSDETIVAAAVGFAAHSIGLWLLRQQGGQGFRAAFGAAAATAGAVAASIGIGIEGDSPMVGALVAMALTATTIAFSSGMAGVSAQASGGPTAQFLTALWSIGLFLVAVEDVAGRLLHPSSTAAITLPLGAALILFPPAGRDLRPLAIALLATLPIDTATEWFIDFGEPDHVARAVASATLAWLMAEIWRLGGRPASLLPISVAAVGTGLLLPAGGAASFVVLTLAFLLGSRLMAAAGLASAAFFVWQFYYELTVPLAEKAALLAAVGAALLLAAWTLRERVR